MTPDEVIALRKHWLEFNYAPAIPEAFVLATPDWLRYVQAMAAAIPAAQDVVHPSEEDVYWAWPYGVAVVFSETVTMEHLIISKSTRYTHERHEPRIEHQVVRGFVVGPLQPVAAETEDGTPVALQTEGGEELHSPVAHPLLWIAEDPSDVITGHWIPGQLVLRRGEREISESTRFATALISALGHRLTEVGAVSGPRGERRRVARELPALRVLRLASGARVERSDEEQHSVAWQRRWLVRGHWRLQPYGEGRRLRRMRWIDPYVKGPEDKPFDARPTLWKT